VEGGRWETGREETVRSALPLMHVFTTQTAGGPLCEL
jgi:hypothetical protein